MPSRDHHKNKPLTLAIHLATASVSKPETPRSDPCGGAKPLRFPDLRLTPVEAPGETGLRQSHHELPGRLAPRRVCQTKRGTQTVSAQRCECRDFPRTTQAPAISAPKERIKRCVFAAPGPRVYTWVSTKAKPTPVQSRQRPKIHPFRRFPSLQKGAPAAPRHKASSIPNAATCRHAPV